LVSSTIIRRDVILKPFGCAGDEIIDEEESPLCDYQVKHLSTLYLDTGKVVTAGSKTILIRACLQLDKSVSNNDGNNVAFGSKVPIHADGRSAPIEVEIAIDASVRDLRDKLG
jgi:hypothetical protein